MSATYESTSLGQDERWPRVRLTPPRTNSTERLVQDTSREHSKWKRLVIATATLLCIGIIIVLIVSLTTKIEEPPPTKRFTFPISPNPLKTYKNAAVAADNGICSQIGTRILREKGGHAVDAAIATAICSGLANIYATGIGGGFFMTIWSQSEQKGYVVDAREIAPMEASQNMFNSGISSSMGPLSIAVPGEIGGYWAAHQKFGKVAWRDLFKDTIQLCQEGFPVSNGLARGITLILNRIHAEPNGAPYGNLMKYLYNPKTNQFYVEGDIMHCPDKLVVTLEKIANSGSAKDFYTGALAKDILSDLEEVGSIINATDLENYFESNLVSENLIDMNIINSPYRMLSVRPPGSGAILGYSLNILTGYGLDQESRDDTLTYHRFVESLKFGYGERLALGDEAFVPSVKYQVLKLTSSNGANYARSRIDDSKTHNTNYYLPTAIDEASNQGTCHLSVIDSQGNAVAFTATINAEFGSGVMGSRTGITFNDEMDDFSKPNQTNYWNLPPSESNFVRPGKRPQSSMCPAVFLEQINGTYEAALIIGASGGSRITSGTAYAATRILWFKEDPKEAIDALRLHHQLIPEILYYEPEMSPVILQDLYNKGEFNQSAYTTPISIVQAIQIVDSKRLAFSDYRKELSFPDGY